MKTDFWWKIVGNIQTEFSMINFNNSCLLKIMNCQSYSMITFFQEVMKRCIVWDKDGDGLIENSGFPDQTYDAWVVKGVRWDYFLMIHKLSSQFSAYTGGLWLAALYAICQMSRHLNIDCSYFSELLKKGKLAYEVKLWTGNLNLLYFVLLFSRLTRVFLQIWWKQSLDNGRSTLWTLVSEKLRCARQWSTLVVTVVIYLREDSLRCLIEKKSEQRWTLFLKIIVLLWERNLGLSMVVSLGVTKIPPVCNPRNSGWVSTMPWQLLWSWRLFIDLSSHIIDL